MSSDSLPTGLHARSGPSPTPVHAHLDLPASARMILRLLEKLQYGALRLRTPDGRILLYGDASHPVHQRALPGPTRLVRDGNSFLPLQGFEALFA